jgi:hypothetical protein
MAIELHVFTVREFMRYGAHGEVDWDSTRIVLGKFAKAFAMGGSGLAIFDVRDATTSLTDEEIIDLADVFHEVGVSQSTRLAVLHRPRPNPKAGFFAAAAVHLGFDVESFDNYEAAVEWLSHPGGSDPEFERETYVEPKSEKDVHPPSDGRES